MSTTRDKFVAILDKKIENFNASVKRRQECVAAAEAIDRSKGFQICSFYFACHPHGNGWRLDAPIECGSGFCVVLPASSSPQPNIYGPADVHAPLQRLRQSPPTSLQALKSLVDALPVSCVSSVWFEEITDPMTIWQVLHFTSDPGAKASLEAFYEEHSNVFYDVEGLIYTKSPCWVGQYSREKINKICEELNHSPLFKN